MARTKTKPINGRAATVEEAIRHTLSILKSHQQPNLWSVKLVDAEGRSVKLWRIWTKRVEYSKVVMHSERSRYHTISMVEGCAFYFDDKARLFRSSFKGVAGEFEVGPLVCIAFNSLMASEKVGIMRSIVNRRVELVMALKGVPFIPFDEL